MKDADVLKVEVEGWPLPNGYLLELGRLAAIWSALESAVDLYIAKLAGFNDPTDPRGFILLKHSSFPQKLDSLAALCDQLQGEFSQLREYPATVSKIRSAQKGRNRFAHNGLSENEETGRVEIAEGSVRGKLKVSVAEVSLADIRRVTFDIHDAMLSLHTLVTGKTYPRIWEIDA
jgi:hypothetical protein